MLSPDPTSDKTGIRCSASGVPRHTNASLNHYQPLTVNRRSLMSERKKKIAPYRRHRSVLVDASSWSCQRGCAAQQLPSLCLLPPAAPDSGSSGYLQGKKSPVLWSRQTACLSICRLERRDRPLHQHEPLSEQGVSHSPWPSPVLLRAEPLSQGHTRFH